MSNSTALPRSRNLIHKPGLSGKVKAGINSIIHGENLQVLDVISPSLERKVTCIYIDPPYNNQEEYNHYDDRLDHETWLNEIKVRIQKLVPLLNKNGSLWISIDDAQLHYLKVLADEILGRDKFITTIAWEHRRTRENRKVFSHNHEYILLYAIDPSAFKKYRNGLPLSQSVISRYKNPDNDPRGLWQSISANVQAGHATQSQFYEITGPTGIVHAPPPGRCWVYTKKRMDVEISSGNIWFGKDGDGVPRIKKFQSDSKVGLTPLTLWKADDVGTTRDAKKHILALFKDKPVFETPKPETLIHQIIYIATNPNDIVLDAYLGSGTTSAVAHKMGRRYVGIEQNSDAALLCASRLKQVIDGEQGGISNQVNWKGGGGFTFFKFAD